MKKLVTLCCLSLLAAAPAAMAQIAVPAPDAVVSQDATPASEKDIVVIDLFARNRTVPQPYAQALRGHVISGFADRGRHRLLDAEALGDMAEPLPGRGLTTPETATADVAALLEMRAPLAAGTDARYLVSGAVADYKFEHVQLPATDSKHPPRQGFKSTFRVLLSAYDLKFRRPLPDEFFTLTASAPTADDADLAALATIRKTLEYYIDRNFKFESIILELCKPDKKGRIKELYIHSGTDMGVRPGDLFMVYEEVAIGGVPTHQKVGRLRVNDVQNRSVARCKITKGDAEIASAFEAGRALICVSDGKAFGY